MVALFTVTTFTGASLLFVVQPLVTKLVLPSYGGSATVWSTSSLFFQVLLLVAYLYAHLSARWFGTRWQPRAQVPLGSRDLPPSPDHGEGVRIPCFRSQSAQRCGQVEQGCSLGRRPKPCPPVV